MNFKFLGLTPLSDFRVIGLKADAFGAKAIPAEACGANLNLVAVDSSNFLDQFLPRNLAGVVVRNRGRGGNQ